LLASERTPQLQTWAPDVTGGVNGVVLLDCCGCSFVTQISTLAALAYHKSTGRVAAKPNQRMGFAANFLYMLDSNGSPAYKPNPKLARALEVMFILHQEHEMNCSTAACRHLASRWDAGSSSIKLLTAITLHTAVYQLLMDIHAVHQLTFAADIVSCVLLLTCMGLAGMLSSSFHTAVLNFYCCLLWGLFCLCRAAVWMFTQLLLERLVPCTAPCMVEPTRQCCECWSASAALKTSPVSLLA
jgi:hypothetical protein